MVCPTNRCCLVAVGHHHRFIWSQLCICRVCSKTCYLCPVCIEFNQTSIRKRKDKFGPKATRELSNHHRNYHRQDIATSATDEDDVNYQDLFEDNVDQPDFMSTMEQHGIILAIQELVVRCCTTIQPSLAEAKTLPMQEVESFLLRTRLVLRNGSTDQRLLSQLLAIESNDRIIPLPTIESSPCPRPQHNFHQ